LRSGATPICISSVPAPGILSKTFFLIAEPVQAAKRINNVKNRLKRRIFFTTKKCAAFATTNQRLLTPRMATVVKVMEGDPSERKTRKVKRP
jgi:hypothetical protein